MGNLFQGTHRHNAEFLHFPAIELYPRKAEFLPFLSSMPPELSDSFEISSSGEVRLVRKVKSGGFLFLTARGARLIKIRFSTKSPQSKFQDLKKCREIPFFLQVNTQPCGRSQR